MKVQCNLWIEQELKSELMAAATRDGCQGISDFLARRLTGYLTGDLNGILECLLYSLTRANGGIDMDALGAIHKLAGTFLHEAPLPE